MPDGRQARQRGRNERPRATGASGQPPSLWRGEARACGVTNVAEEAATAEMAAGAPRWRRPRWRRPRPSSGAMIGQRSSKPDPDVGGTCHRRHQCRSRSAGLPTWCGLADHEQAGHEQAGREQAGREQAGSEASGVPLVRAALLPWQGHGITEPPLRDMHLLPACLG